MDSRRGKKRRMSGNSETGVAVDRLSSLPNDLIHKILSFISIKETVKTASWSSRYRFIWTTMPYLNFTTRDFPKMQKFSKFVTQFLKRRNNQIDVFSLKLSFHGNVTQPSIKKLMDYVFSHNVQRLNVKLLYQKKDIEFPLSLFGSAAGSLKHLSFKSNISHCLKATSTFELPVLTTLYLRGVTFCSDDPTDNCADLLSKCASLKNLTLVGCDTDGLRSLSICHPGLVNLTIEGGPCGVKVVNVDAPQLEKLTIRGCHTRSREHVISAPNLASFAYRGYYPLHLSADGFNCLKEADISVIHPNIADDAHQMVCLLEQLHNVKFLKLNLEIIEHLSSSVELIVHQPSPFVNLKSLTIYPRKLSELEMRNLPKGKVNLSTEVKRYLLDSSPGATLTMFSREEIIAVRDIPSTRKLMAELRVLLEQEKATSVTKVKEQSDNAKMHKRTENGKAQPEMKMQLQIGGNRELFKSYWKDLSVQFEQRKAKACLIISMCERIEGVLEKLPATKRAMIQPCFSSLCAEADTIMIKIMKMQCDENQSRFNVCFNEVATSTTMEPTS